jgi:hypothetical protein
MRLLRAEVSPFGQLTVESGAWPNCPASDWHPTWKAGRARQRTSCSDRKSGRTRLSAVRSKGSDDHHNVRQ